MPCTPARSLCLLPAAVLGALGLFGCHTADVSSAPEPRGPELAPSARMAEFQRDHSLEGAILYAQPGTVPVTVYWDDHAVAARAIAYSFLVRPSRGAGAVAPRLQQAFAVSKASAPWEQLSVYGYAFPSRFGPHRTERTQEALLYNFSLPWGQVTHEAERQWIAVSGHVEISPPRPSGACSEMVRAVFLSEFGPNMVCTATEQDISLDASFAQTDPTLLRRRRFERTTVPGFQLDIDCDQLLMTPTGIAGHGRGLCESRSLLARAMEWYKP